MKLVSNLLKHWCKKGKGDVVYLMTHSIQKDGELLYSYAYPCRSWDSAVKLIAKKVKRSPKDIETYLRDSADFFMDPQINFKDNYFKVAEVELI